MEGDRRRGEDPRRRPAQLIAGPGPERPDDDRAAQAQPRRRAGLRRVRGPWRVAVTESSMHPAIEPGDWLLVDPTTAAGRAEARSSSFGSPTPRSWRSSAVARPGDRVPYAEGYLILGDDEAWLLSDANEPS